MAFLDKFNDWYNRAVPDEEPGVRWMEPAQGSRYRWKNNIGGLVLTLAFVIGVILVPLSGKHGRAPAPFNERLILAAAFGFLLVVGGWASTFSRTSVFLSKKVVVVGTGRSRISFSIDGATSLRLESVTGYRTIVFTKCGSEKLRVFLQPENDSEVLTLFG